VLYAAAHLQVGFHSWEFLEPLVLAFDRRVSYTKIGMNENVRPVAGLLIVNLPVRVSSNLCLERMFTPTAWLNTGFSVAAEYPGIATRPNAVRIQEVAA
jgi:hypothetical protein